MKYCNIYLKIVLEDISRISLYISTMVTIFKNIKTSSNRQLTSNIISGYLIDIFHKSYIVRKETLVL